MESDEVMRAILRELIEAVETDYTPGEQEFLWLARSYLTHLEQPEHD